MKTSISSLIIIAGLFSIIGLVSSCAKPDHSADLPKEQQIVGNWFIARLELNIYSGGVLVKDSIIPRTTANYVKFEDTGGFTYRFNTSSENKGTYQFVGADSVVSVTPASTYRWKILLLTKELLTVRNTNTNHPSFPGATVISYHTFSRY